MNAERHLYGMRLEATTAFFIELVIPNTICPKNFLHSILQALKV